MKVRDKVVMVTGGGSGIGRELVLGLLARGAKVLAVDRSERGLAGTVELAAAAGGNLETIVVDITDHPAVSALLPLAIKRFGGIDGVINNAGIVQPFVPINDLDFNAIDRVIAVNVYGPLYVIKTFLPHLLGRTEGHIVNVSSMGGYVAFPGQTLYGATKAAIKLLSEGLDSELTASRVRVTVVFPGAVNTNIMAHSGLAQPTDAGAAGKGPQPMSASKAAITILDAMERNAHSVLVGKDAKIMSFLSRVSPRFAAKLIYRQMKHMLKLA